MTTPRIRATENLHILLWLIKDTCWVQGYELLGVSMIMPTISVAVFLTVRTRKVKEEFIHNLAVVFWIIANCTWMVGEFYGIDEGIYGLRHIALIPFSIGLLILAVYYYLHFTSRRFRDK